MIPFIRIAALMVLTTATPTLSFAQTITQREGNLTQFSTPGNLAATQVISCIPLDSISPTHSPADIAGGIVDCYQDDNFEAAIPLTLVLLARAAFDTRRVEDRSAHQARTVLILQLRSLLNEEQNSRLQDLFQTYLPESPRHSATCAQLRDLGTPNHDPSYMIKHGARAFFEPSGDGLVENFDADAAYRWVLETYMHCPA